MDINNFNFWVALVIGVLTGAVVNAILVTAAFYLALLKIKKDEQVERDRDKRFEELRETYKLNLTEFRDSYNRDIDELETENKRLKEQIKVLEEQKRE